MKTILYVMLDQWADWEGAYLSSAVRMLGKNSFNNNVVSLSKNRISSIGGFRLEPDYDLHSVPEDYDALILVGGMSWRETSARAVRPLVEACIAKGKVLGAICDAAAFLGVIGVLNSVRHTGNDLNDLKAWAGDAYTGENNYAMEQVVSDHNIVTANGTAALEFAREVLLALKAAPEDKILDWYRFHKQGCYLAPMPKDAMTWEQE